MQSRLTCYQPDEIGPLVQDNVKADNTAGSSSVATTGSTATAGRRLRRLLQASSENVDMTINLPAGTNVTQVIAALQAASANGYGSMLAAGQAA